MAQHTRRDASSQSGDAREPVSSTALLERAPATRGGDDLDADEELEEFVEFFTHTRPDLAAIQPSQTPPGLPSPHRSRLARATEHVRNVAIIRPEVSLNWLHVLTSLANPPRLLARLRVPRRLKLPPVWVLANLAAILALLVAFAPQILMATSGANCAWYTVQPGDTLGEISQLYGSSASEIASANHVQNINLIHVNQRLCIPITSTKPLTAAIALLPAKNAPSGVRAFIAFTLPFARQASQKTGWPVSVILAQWGLETGWRTYTFTGYNWGNCGAMPGQPTIHGTTAPGSPARFAFAYTPEQGIAEYTHVAHLHYYTGVARAWKSGGADAAARALGSSPWDWGHYTNHNSPGSSLIALMRAYNLYWYDTH